MLDGRQRIRNAVVHAVHSEREVPVGAEAHPYDITVFEAKLGVPLLRFLNAPMIQHLRFTSTDSVLLDRPSIGGQNANLAEPQKSFPRITCAVYVDHF